MFEDLRHFIEYLKKEGEVMVVDEELSPRFEIAAAIKLIAEQDSSVAFFNKVKGYSGSIVGNLLGAKKRLAMAMDIKETDLAESYLKRRNNPIKPIVVDNGPVKENIISSDIDILKTMPVLTHHEKDAGPYFTTGVITARDPETGIRGVGIHRVQVKGPHTVGIFLNTPPLGTFLEKAEKRNEPLEIAIILGLDPVCFFSSVIWAPEGIDKFDIAGGLSGGSISLVPCESVDLEVPAGAEFVLEGKVLPHQREPEGPFGESTGYYFTFNNPVAEIQTIMHRNDPVYHTLMPMAGEEEVLIDFSWQMENKNLLLNAISGLKDIALINMGLVTIAQIDKQSQEDGIKIIEQLFECGIPNKIIIIVDQDVDINREKDIWWALTTRFQPHKDVIIKENMPGLGIDPSTQQEDSAVLVTRTSKIGIDATKPLDDLERLEKIKIPPQVKKRVEEILHKAKKRGK